tara:strand:+ start:1 stop:939 length:939 start_codon:yes stop_codon:yes gene_type:complete
MEKNNWEPIIFENESYINSNNNYINQLITGNKSCIIVKNLITYDECQKSIQVLIDKNIINNKYDINLNLLKLFNFRHNNALSDIGLTIDNMMWIKTDINKLWNQLSSVNKFLNSIYDDDNFNIYNVFINIIEKICGNNYNVEFMNNNDNYFSKGIIRIHNKGNNTNFPYHTDGFNYGCFTNGGITDNIREQIPVASKNFGTNITCACILILKQSKNVENIKLYNCLVDDLITYKDKIQGRSHRVGTKYSNINLLQKILSEKKCYNPILNNGDFYIFSASRIHKLENIIENKRIVLATFFAVDILNKKIIIYQ